MTTVPRANDNGKVPGQELLPGQVPWLPIPCPTRGQDDCWAPDCLVCITRKERRESRTIAWWISHFPHVYVVTLTLASPDPRVTGSWVVELRRGLDRTWTGAALIYAAEPNQADEMFHVYALVIVDAPTQDVRDRIRKLWRRRGSVDVDPVIDASDAAHYMLKRLADPATIADHLALNAGQRFRRSGPIWTSYREVRSAYLDRHSWAD